MPCSPPRRQKASSQYRTSSSFCGPQFSFHVEPLNLQIRQLIRYAMTIANGQRFKQQRVGLDDLLVNAGQDGNSRVVAVGFHLDILPHMR